MDWSEANTNYLATGSNDCLVKLLDLRKVFASIHADQKKEHPVVATLHEHTSKVQTVKFSPFNWKYLASTGEAIYFWNLEEALPPQNSVLDLHQADPFLWLENSKEYPETTRSIQCNSLNPNLVSTQEREGVLVLKHIGHIG
eukprot:CAMPEP_0170512116 /NCGR_PEP_ID=MMETSP0208-20121228/66673_1 /TAXON_ID=197538 /ORGANISM="Strombidium inclinatum, Strain S3" /LENGTH=141 /DNA_ID=CAMNT_0010795713 /DNA_START=1030 /DNA_END=1455 /DNA_ORIENTATION=-